MRGRSSDRRRFDPTRALGKTLRVVGILVLTAVIVLVATIIRKPDEPDEQLEVSPLLPSSTTTPVGIGTGPPPTEPAAGGALDGSVSTTAPPPADQPARIVAPDTAAMAPGASLILEGVQVDDPESAAAGTTVAVLLISTHGTVAIGQSQGLLVQGSRNGSAYMPMSGSLADINAALATLRYRPERTFIGTGEVWVFASDLVEVAGRPRNDLHIIRISVG